MSQDAVLLGSELRSILGNRIHQQLNNCALRLVGTKNRIHRTRLELSIYKAQTEYSEAFMPIVQGVAEWTPIFQRVIKNERNKLQKKALYFRKVFTI